MPSGLPLISKFADFGQTIFGSKWHAIEPNTRNLLWLSPTACGRRLDICETIRLDVVFTNRPDNLCRICEPVLIARYVDGLFIGPRLRGGRLAS